MLVIKSKKEMMDYRKAHLNQTIGLVPTMGGLHQGHLDLVHQIKTKVDLVVATIFVNPSQFSPGEDFQNYPRNLDEDLKKLEKLEVDCVFTPEISEMFTDQESLIRFNFGHLSNILCGKSRKNFLSGIALIISKLFNIIRPDFAIFGQKDYQQYKIIEIINKQLEFNVNLILAPISRNLEGLALSSRNQYLSSLDQKKAPQLYQILLKTEKMLLKNKNNLQKEELVLKVTKKVKKKLKLLGFKTDYLSILNYPHLTYLNNEDESKKAIVLVACYLHKTRLIDNKIIQLK